MLYCRCWCPVCVWDHRMVKGRDNTPVWRRHHHLPNSRQRHESTTPSSEQDDDAVSTASSRFQSPAAIFRGVVRVFVRRAGRSAHKSCGGGLGGVGASSLLLPISKMEANTKGRTTSKNNLLGVDGSVTGRVGVETTWITENRRVAQSSRMVDVGIVDALFCSGGDTRSAESTTHRALQVGIGCLFGQSAWDFPVCASVWYFPTNRSGPSIWYTAPRGRDRNKLPPHCQRLFAMA
jgi:hypothetical protein